MVGGCLECAVKEDPVLFVESNLHIPPGSQTERKKKKGKISPREYQAKPYKSC